MAKIRKGNVILHVEDEEVQHYLTLGYSLIGEQGKVLREGAPQTESDFRRAYTKQATQIAELEAEVARLKAELAAKKSTKKSST